jgi:hypothetical protein
MPTCPHCGQDLPSERQEFDPGFKTAVMTTAPFNERYDAIRRDIELARKDLRNGGWARLYSALVKLRKLGDEEPALRHWNNITKVILGKSSKEVFDLLGTHQTCEQLAQVGFDEQLLRGPEELVDRKLSLADPRAFNHGAVKKAITAYKHFRMWNRKASI